MATTDFDTVTVTLDRQTAQEIAVTLWGITSLIHDDTDPTLQRLRNATFIMAEVACELPADYFASWERMP